MFQIKKDNNLTKISLAIVLLVYFFLRFYLIEQRIIFGWDQARDAQVVSQILSGKLTLIGPRVLGPDKFFLGPYFYYLLVSFYLITQGSPIAMIYFLTCYNLVFVSLFWLIIKKLFSEKVALFALLLWAVNPSLVSNDIISWNPVLVPLIVLAIWYLCWLIQAKKNNQFIYLFLGFVLGLGINFHFQMIFLVPFVILFFWFNKRVVNIKRIFLATAGFFVAFFPLFLFDLRHNFLNSRLFVKFFTGGQESKNILAWLPVLKNFISGFTGFNLSSLLALVLFILLALAFFWKSKKECLNGFGRSFCLATSGLFLIILAGFSLYGARPSEYYFNFLIPFVIVFLADFLARRRFGQVIVFSIALFWFSLTLNRLGPNPFSLASKMAAVNHLTAELNQERVNVAFSVPPSEDSSYIYLINQAGYQIDPSAGPQYTVVAPADREPVSVTVGNIGLILPEKRN
ncbi:MAG: ArnT family glycosyltransferase [Patescibacteria group bacterium]|jgi:4-amino-4-deoxy-L-arabinose transferase-like glycosyltransferase